MAQAKSISYDSGERLLANAVEIFRALAALRKTLPQTDHEPPLPDDILDHLPFRLTVRTRGGKGLVRLLRANGSPSYEARWNLQKPLARAS